MPGLTITQAPEPVETSHSCCRGNISIIPHTHSVSRRRWPDSRGATQQAASSKQRAHPSCPTHTRAVIVGRDRTRVEQVCTVQHSTYAVARWSGCSGRALPRLAPRSHVGIGIGKQGPPSVLCLPWMSARYGSCKIWQGSRAPESRLPRSTISSGRNHNVPHQQRIHHADETQAQRQTRQTAALGWLAALARRPPCVMNSRACPWYNSINSWACNFQSRNIMSATWPL